jgi:hypothetical protein
MKWVTRKNPHVDRCASSWLIKRFIDREAAFEFIEREDPIPEGAIPFTLPGAEIRPIEGKRTTYDVLLDKYDIEDPIAIKVGEFIHDFEIDANEQSSEVRLPETLGLIYVLKGLEKVSKSDKKTIEDAHLVLDAFSGSLGELKKEPDSYRLARKSPQCRKGGLHK